MSLLRLVAVALALSPVVALRAATSSAVQGDPKIATPAEIKAKWDKMDDFLGIMFKIACSWKHNKDVHGLAAEKFKDGELANSAEVKEFKKQTQAENVQMVKQACGKIVASGEKKCRTGCAEGWGKALGKRDECDEKCVEAYSKFESSCKIKADNLEQVYAMNMNMADSRKRCYEGHCKELPTVWLKEEADMPAEVDAQCTTQCDPAQITKRCERKWLLEVDFVRGSVRSKCHDEGQVKQCYEGKQATHSGTLDTCKSDGLATCGTQFDKCKADGKTDATFKDAAAFCNERKKMCEEQVGKNCLDDYNANLEAAKNECEQADADALNSCESAALAQKETDSVSKCEGELGPKCDKDCHDACDVADMNKCLGNLEGQGDPTADFCTDFWRLLHESSEMDPVTGNPIVLLANK